jgi:phage/plasmid-like protein (TIGR03299 family)
VLARINEGGSDTEIVKGDAVRKFLMLSNSHDGTTSVRVGFTPVRIVCANTLAMAHTSGSALIRLRHSSSVAANLDALRETINVANKSFEATAMQYRALASKQINRADLEQYIKIVLGQGATKTEDLSTRTKNQIDEIVTLFDHGRGNNMLGVRGTVWAAYNAVTEYLTHANGSDADKRYSSLWFGTNAVRNSTALAEALKLIAA